MVMIFWLFPIVFMLHELEEIIGFKLWLEKNRDVVERYPRLRRLHQNFSIEGFAVAVLEEYLLCIVITGASLYFNSYIVWLGAFIAFSIHLFFHLIQSLLLRRYIPCLVSSILLLPISIIIIGKVIEDLDYEPSTIIISSILCLLAILLNLVFAHKIMALVTARLKNSSEVL